MMFVIFTTSHAALWALMAVFLALLAIDYLKRGEALMASFIAVATVMSMTCSALKIIKAFEAAL